MECEYECVHGYKYDVSAIDSAAGYIIQSDDEYSFVLDAYIPRDERQCNSMYPDGDVCWLVRFLSHPYLDKIDDKVYVRIPYSKLIWMRKAQQVRKEWAKVQLYLEKLYIQQRPKTIGQWLSTVEAELAVRRGFGRPYIVELPPDDDLGCMHHPFIRYFIEPFRSLLETIHSWLP